ncbi:hypothetical protein SAMN05444409_3060 [Epilithonimonas zeae]|uniref:Uncharacterized protein n=1 Tax=Epilithonimonas zeae TaxID=1416779 RepID=A0A1N6IW24_9FLAO|nr:hypothetical protein SAMN05444409_3060 [Epilithonimonas zeae]
MKINNPRNVSFGDYFFVTIRIGTSKVEALIISTDIIPNLSFIAKLYLYLLNSQNL